MSYTYDFDAKYHKLHTWVRMENGLAVVGVSDYAQQRLSDVMWVELPAVGAAIAQGDAVCYIESIKSSGEAYSPVSGEVVEVNQELAATPDLINRDPYGQAWLAKLRPGRPDELAGLMNAESYEAFVTEEEQTGGH
jgi:glycine cleavage system H protein